MTKHQKRLDNPDREILSIFRNLLSNAKGNAYISCSEEQAMIAAVWSNHLYYNQTEHYQSPFMLAKKASWAPDWVQDKAFDLLERCVWPVDILEARAFPPVPGQVCYVL